MADLAAREATVQEKTNMQVKEIMTENPTCCTPETSVHQVTRIMVENDCGSVPVVDGDETRRLIGIITDRDICCRAIAEGKNPLNMKVFDLMTRAPVTVTPETTVEDCCTIMEEKLIRRVPVVNAKGECCGIVAQADLATGAPRQAEEVVREISKATGAASNM